MVSLLGEELVALGGVLHDRSTGDDSISATGHGGTE
jgi:hypothetical protein